MFFFFLLNFPSFLVLILVVVLVMLLFVVVAIAVSGCTPNNKPLTLVSVIFNMKAEMLLFFFVCCLLLLLLPLCCCCCCCCCLENFCQHLPLLTLPLTGFCVTVFYALQLILLAFFIFLLFFFFVRLKNVLQTVQFGCRRRTPRETFLTWVLKYFFLFFSLLSVLTSIFRCCCCCCCRCCFSVLFSFNVCDLAGINETFTAHTKQTDKDSQKFAITVALKEDKLEKISN